MSLADRLRAAANRADAEQIIADAKPSAKELADTAREMHSYPIHGTKPRIAAGLAAQAGATAKYESVLGGKYKRD